MQIVIDCLDETEHDPIFVAEAAEAFDRIAARRPELVERYSQAISQRSSAEIERLLLICQELVQHEDVWIGNLRINAVTQRFHVGNGSRSAVLFAPSRGR